MTIVQIKKTHFPETFVQGGKKTGFGKKKSLFGSFVKLRDYGDLEIGSEWRAAQKPPFQERRAHQYVGCKKGQPTTVPKVL